MNKEESDRLIVKYITREAGREEIEQLTEWLKDPTNEDAFNELVEINYVADFLSANYDKESAKAALFRKMQEEQQQVRPTTKQPRFYLKYAAALVVFLTMGYVLQQYLSTRNSEDLIPKEEAITLTLPDGSVQCIEATGSADILDHQGKVIGKQERNRLSYGTPSKSPDLLYNTLSIPNGKQLELELSDGTVIYLNSGTSIRYPISFTEKQNTREIYLKGEAFLQVTKDKQHPFIVHTTNDVDVQVLGTAFNITAYEDDKNTDVVLTEGKVSMTSKTAAIELLPGEKGTRIKGVPELRKDAVNTNNYTAWTKGVLVFKNQTFQSIVKRLERHYNVSFTNENKSLSHEIFSASFKKGATIEEVLKFLNKTYAINYKIMDNKIIIK